MGHDDDTASLIGLEVGGYVVENEIGRGGMGVVFAATHPMIGKRAAIKVMSRELMDNPAIVERFLQEARSVNKIGHPNIVDIFAFGVLPDGRSYLVMDLLQGEPLRKRIKRGPLSVRATADLIDEITSALIAAHDKGFIHRDLKPDNVFLVENPVRFEIKLLDFGLAKLLPGANLDRAYRTATGAMIGTPDYMSPEQLRGSRVDHRTDIYALGVMSFEVLTRTRPHRFPDGTFDLEGMTFRDVLLAVPGVPVELAALIEAMTAHAPSERPTLAAIAAVIKRVKPSLPAGPAASNVRAAASAMSIGAFTPSNLGAVPLSHFTPPTGVERRTPETLGYQPPARPTPPTLAHEHDAEAAAQTLAYQARQAYVADRMSAPVSVPPALSQTPLPSSGFRSSDPALPPSFGITKFGVPPPPTRTSKPHPVSAARRRSNPILLVSVLLLVVGAAITLVIVLMT